MRPRSFRLRNDLAYIVSGDGTLNSTHSPRIEAVLHDFTFDRRHHWQIWSLHKISLLNSKLLLRNMVGSRNFCLTL